MVASVAILLLVSIGIGVQKDVTKQVDDLGVNLLFCLPGRVDLNSMGFNPNLGGQSWYKEEDRDRLRDVSGVKDVAIFSFAGGGIRAGEKESYPLIIAATPEWFGMHKMRLKEGSLYSRENQGDVVVLGGVAAQELFGEQSAVGKSIEINQHTFQVIGVTEDKQAEQSLFSFQSFSNVAYYPFEVHKKISERPQIDRFIIQADYAADPVNLVPSLEAALASRLDRQQFSVLTQQDLLKVIYSLMSILSTLVIGLTSIALFVGGVGILAVMMMSVSERRKEIGVRKALGATRRDIFWQFLIEAGLIGLAGVLAGLAFSSVVAWGLAAFTRIKPEMTLGTVLLAFTVGIGVGAVSGMIPALRAARQDPVVSLRNE